MIPPPACRPLADLNWQMWDEKEHNMSSVIQGPAKGGRRQVVG